MEVVRTQDEQHKIERSLHMVAGKRWQPIGKANLAKQNPENGNRDALPRPFRRRHFRKHPSHVQERGPHTS